MLDKPLAIATIIVLVAGIFFYYGYTETKCLDEDYSYCKGMITETSYDGAGNPGFDYEHSVNDITYKGTFASRNKFFDVTIGDSIIVKYCSKNPQRARIAWEDKAMLKYKRRVPSF